MIVKLTGFEMFQAAMVGARRQIEAISRGYKDRHGFNGSGWDVHIEGAAGEMAAAKALGLYWGGDWKTFKTGGDVSGLEVRTRSRSEYDLLIRSDDPDKSIYVLVTGKSPDFEVVGWAYGWEAKQERYERNYGDRASAFFIPRADLRPIEELSHARIH